MDMRKTRLYFVFVLHLGAVISSGPSGGEWVEWSPTGWDGLPLYCPSYCLQETFHALCCQCESLSVFDFDQTPCRVGVSAGGEIIPNNCEGSTVLENTFHNLYKFPKNICDFPGITKIILSGNLILEIPDLSCLANLTYLDLSWNKITTLRNASLVGNRNLRSVNLSYNAITHIETGVLDSLAFLSMYLRGNSVTSLDVTDLIISRTFCMIDIAYNKIESIVNNNNWTVDVNHNYGTGVYNGTYNRMKGLPDWKKLGFPTLRYLGKLLWRAYDMRNNPISCNCFLAQPLAYFRPLLITIDRDFFNVECQSPDMLRGRLVQSFGEGDHIRELICNHTEGALCPQSCTCVTEPRFSEPQYDKIVFVTIISCSNSPLHRLPHVLPKSDEIEFHFTGKSVTRVTAEHYLSRVTVFNFLFMPQFEKMAISNLTSLKQLSVPRAGQVGGIPRELSRLHPCVFLQESDFVMNCTCSLQWMFEWLTSIREGKCQTQFEFKCCSNKNSTNGTERAISYLQEMDCSVTSTDSVFVLATSMALSTLCGVLLLTATWKRRCEIRIVLRETWIKKLLRRRKTLDQDCVIFISFDGDNSDIRSFILKRLEPFLVTKGFHVFVPSRDLSVGSVRSEESAWQISVSRYYITFLSEFYLSDDVFETRNEWRCIWNGYLSDDRKQLVVLNYDLLKVTDISCSKMKAVVRAGNFIDFSDGENVIFSKISKIFH